MELRAGALGVLRLADPVAKADATRALHAAADLTLDVQAVLHGDGPLPGRPPRPRLVPVAALARRTPFTHEGRAALLHAVAHIEFNAIKMLLSLSIPYRGTRSDDALQLAKGRAAG